MTGLGKVLAGRAFQALTVALVVGVASFAMLHTLPGDIALRIAGGRYGADYTDANAAAAVRAELGLDRPLMVQLADWFGQLLTLDFGRSAMTNALVTSEIAHLLGNSLILAVSSVLMSLVIAIPVGVLAALRPGGIFDRLSSLVSIGLRALPAFVLGIVLTLGLAIRLGIAPVAGHGTAETLILPTLTLAIGLAAVSSRIVRDAVVRVMESEQFQFARAKGLSTSAAVIRHGARNAAIPVVAYVGVQTAYLIEGVVIVESLFSWPGIGHGLVHAIFSRDLPMLQGTALSLGLLCVALNALVDVACAALDPRART